VKKTLFALLSPLLLIMQAQAGLHLDSLIFDSKECDVRIYPERAFDIDCGGRIIYERRQTDFPSAAAVANDIVSSFTERNFEVFGPKIIGGVWSYTMKQKSRAQPGLLRSNGAPPTDTQYWIPRNSTYK
jgi:hypothetical protein